MPEATARAEWTRAAIGDVIVRAVDQRVDPIRDGLTRYVGVDDLNSDDLRLRRWGEVSDGQLPPTFRYAFPAGSVLFPTRRPALRKCAIAPFAGITGEKILVLQSLEASRLDPGFMPFLLSSEEVRTWVVDRAIGSVTPHFRWRDLASYEFLLPPLKEQRRIAHLIQTADHAAETLSDLLEAERVVEGSLLGELVSSRGAQEVSLGSLLTESPRNGCSATETSSPTGHWVLGLSALTRWGYRRGELKAVETTDRMAAAVLQHGDLLISRSNTRELVGLPGVFDENRSDVSWPDTMMRLTPDESTLRRRYLELFLRSPSGRAQVQSFAAGTSASMKKISGANVKRLLIALPRVEVQDHIVNQTESFRHAREASKRRLSELTDLRRSLLSQSLSPEAGRAL